MCIISSAEINCVRRTYRSKLFSRMWEIQHMIDFAYCWLLYSYVLFSCLSLTPWMVIFNNISQWIKKWYYPTFANGTFSMTFLSTIRNESKKECNFIRVNRSSEIEQLYIGQLAIALLISVIWYHLTIISEGYCTNIKYACEKKRLPQKNAAIGNFVAFHLFFHRQQFARFRNVYPWYYKITTTTMMECYFYRLYSLREYIRTKSTLARQSNHPSINQLSNKMVQFSQLILRIYSF